jgi:hypothetical protein
MLEGLGGDHLEPAGAPDGVAERGLAVQALLVRGEPGEVAAPDRPRVLLRGAGVDEQLAAGRQHPGGGGQEPAEVEVVHAVERGDHIQAGGPYRQLLGGGQQRDHPERVAAAGGLELGQHGRRDVGRRQPRAAGQQGAQQPRVPSRPAADIQAGDRAVRQELADRPHRRLVGGAQRFVDDGDPLEMPAHGHLRHLPALGPASDIMRSPCPVHTLFTRTTGPEPSACGTGQGPCGGAGIIGGDEQFKLEENQRLTGARLWVEVLTSKGPLRPALDTGTAADVMWLLMSPGNYYRLVHRRRWTKQQYQQWLAASITQLLFAEHP